MYKPIAIYARVSTARQEEEETIKTQIDCLTQYAASNGLTIIKEYLDDGWSGDTLIRPSLDNLRQEAKNASWEAILIYDPDRLARRYSYQELVMDELREAGKEVLFVTVAAPKNSEDKILYGVRGLFAEYERVKITERMRLGKLRTVREGKIITGEAPFGYKRVKIDKESGRGGYYEIFEAEAIIIRKIFNWYANEAISIKNIIRKLQDLQISPRKSTRGVWAANTINNILKNETYIGRARWNSTVSTYATNPFSTERYRRSRKTSKKSRPRDEWMFVSVPAIISQTTFDKANERRSLNYQLSKRNRRSNYLLAGKVYCTCGNRRTGEGPQTGHKYYRCSSRILSFPFPPKCREKGVVVEATDDKVWKEISRLMTTEKLLLRQLDRFKSKGNNKKMQADDLTLKATQLDKLLNQEKRYNEAYGAGVFTLNELKEYLTPVRFNIEQLEQSLVKLKAEEQTIKIKIPESTDLGAFVTKAQAKLKDLSFEQKRDIVLNTVEKIITTKGHIHVLGCIPITEHDEFKTNYSNTEIESKYFPNALNVKLQTIDRYGWGATPRKSIPFEIHITYPFR